MSTTDQFHASHPDHLIVVGSSSGGIEALCMFVGTLPADFPAPIVLAQHLAPHHSSSLSSLLERRCTLPVHVLAARTLLKAGAIYVVPPNRHVTIEDGFALTQEDHKGRPKPSVDLLFESAAQAYGKGVIAVILTGSGSNGAAGAIEVKRAGGIVIIQNPQTARFPSMPAALPPTLVDFHVDLNQLGPLLSSLLRGEPLLTRQQQGETLDRLLTWLLVHMHIDCRMYKTTTLLRHIGDRMLVTNTTTMQDYLDYLKETPIEAKQLMVSLLVTYTHFFREPEAFAFLKQTVWPELMARARERDQTLRFWSAGCATGEEAYSLAMLVADLLGSELALWKVKIFATDLSEEAIAFARRGDYTKSSLEGLPSTYRERFFTCADHGYRVTKLVRQMLVFGQQDLTHSIPFPTIDLIMCRNVLSYFTSDVQQLVLNRLTFSLSPGGYLFLGQAEGVQPSAEHYQAITAEENVYRCTSKAIGTDPFPGRSPMLLTPPRVKRHSSDYPARSVEQPHAEVPSPAADFGPRRYFNEALFRALPIGIMVIDRAYHLLTANGIARRLLRLPATTDEQDFLHAVPGLPYTQVRTAIDAAFRERNTITLPEVELEVVIGGNGRFVAISLAPLQIEVTPPELVAISVIDVTEQILTRRRLEAMQAEQTQLVNELGNTNKRLDEANKALLQANEALEASNEDMIVAQEELQAKIEELETTNEALQTDIEEMGANEEELEMTNEKLTFSNETFEDADETLNARAGVLQEENSFLFKERTHLAEIIEHAPFPILVLRGPHLLVETFSEPYRKKVQGQDVLDRPLVEVAGYFWDGDLPLVRLASEVYTRDASRNVLSSYKRENGDQPLSYALLPAHEADGSVSGVIIYAIDGTRQFSGATEVNASEA
jgi:two-component system CheB/CheR fusion protein